MAQDEAFGASRNFLVSPNGHANDHLARRSELPPGHRDLTTPVSSPYSGALKSYAHVPSLNHSGSNSVFDNAAREPNATRVIHANLPNIDQENALHFSDIKQTLVSGDQANRSIFDLTDLEALDQNSIAGETASDLLHDVTPQRHVNEPAYKATHRLSQSRSRVRFQGVHNTAPISTTGLRAGLFGSEVLAENSQVRFDDTGSRTDDKERTITPKSSSIAAWRASKQISTPVRSGPRVGRQSTSSEMNVRSTRSEGERTVGETQYFTPRQWPGVTRRQGDASPGDLPPAPFKSQYDRSHGYSDTMNGIRPESRTGVESPAPQSWPSKSITPTQVVATEASEERGEPSTSEARPKTPPLSLWQAHQALSVDDQRARLSQRTRFGVSNSRPTSIVDTTIKMSSGLFDGSELGDTTSDLDDITARLNLEAIPVRPPADSSLATDTMTRPVSQGRTPGPSPSLTRPRSNRTRPRSTSIIHHPPDPPPAPHPQSTPEPAHEKDVSLDYSLAQLLGLPYSNLSNEPFDIPHQSASTSTSIPIPTSHPNSSHPTFSHSLPLPHQLPLLLHHPTSHQKSFLISLSTPAWEETGSWFATQFTLFAKRRVELRRRKRIFAEELEREIGQREQAIRSQMEGIEAVREGLRRGGEKVLRGKSDFGT